ncbi:hypothetical protein F4604DRAFT_1578295, partial [Suillus subluteus]
SIKRKIVTMKLIDHPNMIRLYDVWDTSSELFDYLCHEGRLSTFEASGYSKSSPQSRI